MAVKATCDIITANIDNEILPSFQPLLPRLLQILSTVMKTGDDELLTRIVGMFDDCAISSPPLFGDQLEPVIASCCAVLVWPPSHTQILSSESLSYHERSVACLALSTILSEYNVEIAQRVLSSPLSPLEPPGARHVRRSPQPQLWCRTCEFQNFPLFVAGGMR